MSKKNELKIAVFPQGGYWVAQCLEYDIATQGRDMPQLRARMEYMLLGQMRLDQEHGREPFAGVGPAPDFIKKRAARSRDRSTPLKIRRPKGRSAARVGIPKKAELVFA